MQKLNIHISQETKMTKNGPVLIDNHGCLKDQPLQIPGTDSNK